MPLSQSRTDGALLKPETRHQGPNQQSEPRPAAVPATQPVVLQPSAPGPAPPQPGVHAAPGSSGGPLMAGLATSGSGSAGTSGRAVVTARAAGPLPAASRGAAIIQRAPMASNPAEVHAAPRGDISSGLTQARKFASVQPVQAGGVSQPMPQRGIDRVGDTPGRPRPGTGVYGQIH